MRFADSATMLSMGSAFYEVNYVAKVNLLIAAPVEGRSFLGDDSKIPVSYASRVDERLL